MAELAEPLCTLDCLVSLDREIIDFFSFRLDALSSDPVEDIDDRKPVALCKMDPVVAWDFPDFLLATLLRRVDLGLSS
jgi:hypothetical protein